MLVRTECRGNADTGRNRGMGAGVMGAGVMGAGVMGAGVVFVRRTADGRRKERQHAERQECGTTKRARRFAAAPDFLCGRDIGGGAQRRPPSCSTEFLPSAYCGSCRLPSAVRDPHHHSGITKRADTTKVHRPLSTTESDRTEFSRPPWHRTSTHPPVEASRASFPLRPRHRSSHHRWRRRYRWQARR